MKKRNLILILVAIILVVFTSKVILDKVNKPECIPEELERIEMEVDRLYNSSTDPYKGTYLDDSLDLYENTYLDDSLEFYQNIVEELDIVKVYDSSELTLEILHNRNGKIIIEKCIGEVITTRGDGMVLNSEEEYFINYARIEDIKVGDIVLTYFVYNPDTNAEDDIIERFDYVIDEAN